VIICSAEKNYAGPILLVAACNGPMFGDGLYIAPDALPDDGWMHVTLLGRVNFLDYVKNLARLKRKEKIRHLEAYYFRTKKVEVQITNGKAFTEADGELIGEGNITFEIEPASLRLIMPFEE
jgi:diacylglycerol kinase family enzyme